MSNCNNSCANYCQKCSDCCCKCCCQNNLVGNPSSFSGYCDGKTVFDIFSSTFGTRGTTIITNTGECEFTIFFSYLVDVIIGRTIKVNLQPGETWTRGIETVLEIKILCTAISATCSGCNSSNGLPKCSGTFEVA